MLCNYLSLLLSTSLNIIYLASYWRWSIYKYYPIISIFFNSYHHLNMDSFTSFHVIWIFRVYFNFDMTLRWIIICVKIQKLLHYKGITITYVETFYIRNSNYLWDIIVLKGVMCAYFEHWFYILLPHNLHI